MLCQQKKMQSPFCVFKIPRLTLKIKEGAAGTMENTFVLLGKARTEKWPWPKGRKASVTQVPVVIVIR
jgi:hypothetical protein